VFCLTMIVRGTTMPAIKSYEIHLQIDGVDSIIALDDTYPAVNSWSDAANFAILMARHAHQDATNVEFIDCQEYEAEEYKDIEYVYETPMRLQ
jgi:hypothetical protein